MTLSLQLKEVEKLEVIPFQDEDGMAGPLKL